MNSGVLIIGSICLYIFGVTFSISGIEGNPYTALGIAMAFMGMAAK